MANPSSPLLPDTGVTNSMINAVARQLHRAGTNREPRVYTMKMRWARLVKILDVISPIHAADAVAKQKQRSPQLMRILLSNFRDQVASTLLQNVYRVQSEFAKFTMSKIYLESNA